MCCSCGKPLPSRHHLTWHCPDRLVPEDLVNPVHTAEENFFSVPSPSQLWCLVCLRSTRLKLLLCWLHFVQPIRSVFLSTSSLIAFRYYKKPGVSEQVVLCHVLILVCGNKFPFSHLIPCYISFLLMVRIFLGVLQGSILPFYGVSWVLWLIQKPTLLHIVNFSTLKLIAAHDFCQCC